MIEFLGQKLSLEEGVLKINFPQDFGVTPTSLEQCLAIILWKISEQKTDEDLDNTEDKSVLVVEYQGRSSTSVLTSEKQEELDIFQVVFRKVTTREQFDPGAY